MIQVNTSVVLANNTPKTMLELLRATIAVRTYDTQAQEDAEVNRFGGGVQIRTGSIRPTADIYMIDAYKGVLNGVAVADDWDAADFTDAPGGGELLSEGLEKSFQYGFDPGSRVLFQNSGGDVTIYFDFSFS